MNFCNLLKRFKFAGHDLYFSFCDADDMSVPELNIFADTDEGKEWLQDDDNQDEVHQYVMDNFINKRAGK